MSENNNGIGNDHNNYNDSNYHIKINKNDNINTNNNKDDASGTHNNSNTNNDRVPSSQDLEEGHSSQGRSTATSKVQKMTHILQRSQTDHTKFFPSFLPSLVFQIT